MGKCENSKLKCSKISNFQNSELSCGENNLFYSTATLQERFFMSAVKLLTVWDCATMFVIFRWFYRQIHLLYSNDTVAAPTVFEYNPVTSKLCLKETVSIHCYLSTAPCGDASAFPIESVHLFDLLVFALQQMDTWKWPVTHIIAIDLINLFVWNFRKYLQHFENVGQVFEDCHHVATSHSVGNNNSNWICY